MRDINRIFPFMNKLAGIWMENFPDWRFGQFIENLRRENGDLFYLEEDAFMKAVEDFCQKYKCK